MDQATLAAWAAAGAAGVSALVVFGQALVQRRQGHLQEAEAHREQANAWAELVHHWETALLVATGSGAVWRFGVPDSKAVAYMEAVERYRLAYTALLEVMAKDEISPDDWEKVADDERSALEALAPYQAAVQRIVTHLAQVSGLVLRNRLSLEVAYDAFGLQLIRVGDQLLGLLRCGYDHGSSCVAPGNMERRLWTHLNAEQAAQRIGWGEFLDVARGTAERIVLFQGLLMAHAVNVGDLDGGFDPGQNEGPLEQLGQPDRLAIAWRAARRHGRLRAVRLTRRLASASRRARRRRGRLMFPKWLVRITGKQSWRLNSMFPVDGWLHPTDFTQLPLDFMRVLLDVVGAASRSRAVADVRRMTPPQVAAAAFGVDDPWFNLLNS